MQSKLGFFPLRIAESQLTNHSWVQSRSHFLFSLSLCMWYLKLSFHLISMILGALLHLYHFQFLLHRVSHFHKDACLWRAHSLKNFFFFSKGRGSETNRIYIFTFSHFTVCVWAFPHFLKILSQIYRRSSCVYVSHIRTHTSHMLWLHFHKVLQKDPFKANIVTALYLNVRGNTFLSTVSTLRSN